MVAGVNDGQGERPYIAGRCAAPAVEDVWKCIVRCERCCCVSVIASTNTEVADRQLHCCNDKVFQTVVCTAGPVLHLGPSTGGAT